MPEAVVAITGASGALYAERLLRALSEAEWDVLLIVTREGAINLDLELGMTPDDLAKISGVSLEDNDNLAARSASYNRARSTFIPFARFLCCDFSSCCETTIPVGIWVIRTALSVVLTD